MIMETPTFLVFVYGTLQKNRSNYHVMGNSKFIGNGVLDGFALYQVTYGYPGIKRSEGHKVKGEVYEVSH